MDLFSHGLLGFVLGQALRLGRNAQIILIVSSIILDIDAVLTIAGWEAWFQFHRGPLHSFLGAILVSLAIGVVYTVFMRLPPKSFISIFLICLGGSFSHILMDLLTPWSMAVLWPFSKEKIAFDLTHFFDLIFLGILLLASVLIFYLRNDVKMTQVIAIMAIFLLTINFGVRYYEKDIAIETVKGFNVDADSKVMSLPTLRPDRWWVVVKTPFENGYNYEIYNVDSIGHKILSNNTVKSPFIDYVGPAEPPIDSPQEAVAYSKIDKRVSAFIEKSRLPAANVTLSSDGNAWEIFWYDVFTQLSGGLFRGITVKVEIDGTVIVNSSTYSLLNKTETTSLK